MECSELIVIQSENWKKGDKKEVPYKGTVAILAPMWQQSGTLPFGSCHGIARILVDELQI